MGLAGETQACLQVLVEKKNHWCQGEMWVSNCFFLAPQLWPACAKWLLKILVCCLPGKALTVNTAAQHKEPGAADFILILIFFLLRKDPCICVRLQVYILSLSLPPPPLSLTQTCISKIYFCQFLSQRLVLLRAAMYGCTGGALHNPGGAMFRYNHSPGPGELTLMSCLLPSPFLVGLTFLFIPHLF